MIILLQVFDPLGGERFAHPGSQASRVKLTRYFRIGVLLQQLIDQTNDRGRRFSECPRGLGHRQMHLPGGAAFESDLHTDVFAPLQSYVFDQ
jgi:hypothetical protein